MCYHVLYFRRSVTVKPSKSKDDETANASTCRPFSVHLSSKSIWKAFSLGPPAYSMDLGWSLGLRPLRPGGKGPWSWWMKSVHRPCFRVCLGTKQRGVSLSVCLFLVVERSTPLPLFRRLVARSPKKKHYFCRAVLLTKRFLVVFLCGSCFQCSTTKLESLQHKLALFL